MPTGVAIRDVREQLFDAAERVLLRDGPNALTSRAITTEAGCAKGVLHRHFPDVDGFLVDLVHDRVVRLDRQSAALHAAAGTGTVTGNLTEVLTAVFGSLAVAILGLVNTRDELRARLRRSRTSGGLPLLTEATAMLGSYLRAEQDLGRISREADVGALAPALIGAAHLLFTAHDGGPPDTDSLRRVATTILTGALDEATAPPALA